MTDCGEQTLPYEVRIVKSYLKDSLGRPISGYPEFVRYAKENFEEAVRIFYHQKFLDRYLETLEDKRLYRHLTKKEFQERGIKRIFGDTRRYGKGAGVGRKNVGRTKDRDSGN